MNKTAFGLALLLFVSCGPRPDPAYVEKSGDLAAFIQKQLEKQDPGLFQANTFKSLETKWAQRTITSRHKSGEYLNGRKRIEIRTQQENFDILKGILTESLGKPAYVVGVAIPPDDDTNNHPRWCPIVGGQGIWLSNMKTNCFMDIVVDE